MTVCLLYHDINGELKYKPVYEFIETLEEAELLAQYAMTRKNFQDVAFIFPGNNRSIDKKPEEYARAKELAEKYAVELQEDAFKRRFMRHVSNSTYGLVNKKEDLNER